SFAIRGDGPVQVIAPTRTLTLGETDLSGLADESREAELGRTLRAEAARPFDLSGDLLLRALLVRLGPAAHVLLLTMHHIISDGWSLSIIFRELVERYEAHLAGAPAEIGRAHV